ncbi:hypothetical protein AAC387_Pa02g4009 [Persea americana]
MRFAVFLPSKEEENWKIDFTADGKGGKAAIASFPPLREEGSWKVDFTADGSGGKAAIASFPPLRAEENRRIQLPPIRAAVKLRECPNAAASPFLFQLA